MSDAIHDTVRRLTAANSAHEIAVAYRDLDTGDEVLVDADTPMHAASTMKVPVMIELYRRADAGERALDSTVRLQNEFASIVDGSKYSLTTEDDSDDSLYDKIGTDVTLRELDDRMIRRSSNLATNVLIEILDAKRVQATTDALGAPGMKVLRGVEDGKAYRAGLSNSTTARALMELMAAIAARRAASPASCDAMIEVLRGQEFDDLIPQGLPPGTDIAHKTGWITAIHHDAAIVDPHGDKPWILVVLTRGFADKAESAAAIAEVARVISARRG